MNIINYMRVINKMTCKRRSSEYNQKIVGVMDQVKSIVIMMKLIKPRDKMTHHVKNLNIKQSKLRNHKTKSTKRCFS